MATTTSKIFIDREAATGDFVMRLPEDAVPALYDMLAAAPLLSRRWFYQVKEHIESEYPEYIRHKEKE